MTEEPCWWCNDEQYSGRACPYHLPLMGYCFVCNNEYVEEIGHICEKKGEEE